MERNLFTAITLTLKLNQDEIQWLNGQMQNPLHGQSPDTETKEDKIMRLKFFEATAIRT